jgi:hypothetical protein
MIAKADLIVGAKYAGRCRNASEAVWDGKYFIYTRYKFGDSYPEKIKHPEDESVYDVFEPSELISK